MTAEFGSRCRRWKCELQSTRRFSASHSTNASGIVSIASRSRKSASTDLLGEALLFGDIDGDADQMQAAPLPERLSSQRTRSQIQWPPVCRMRKIWSIWAILPAIRLVGDLEQVDVVGIHQCVDLAEGEKVAASVDSQYVNIDCDQKILPRERSQSHKPAAAAIERGVDTSAHRIIDQVRLAGAGRLPVEGKAEDQDDEARCRRQRDRQRRSAATARIPE